MGRKLTPGLHPVMNLHLFSKGKHSVKLSNAGIKILLLSFTLIFKLTAQNINEKYLTNNYNNNYRNLYLQHDQKASQPGNDSILTVLGRWAWGPCEAADAKGNYAYIGNGQTFQVLDVTNPSSPVIIAEYITNGEITNIKVRYNYVFVCNSAGLLIFDVSNPSQLQKISEVGFGTTTTRLALEGSFVYVTTFGGLMWEVDISDIHNPYIRGSIGYGGEIAYCIAATSGYVYVGETELPVMRIINAQNPDSLSGFEFDVGGFDYSEYIKDTLLFLGVGYGTNYFKIYDVSNPAQPEFISQTILQAQENITSITVSKNGLTAYAGTRNGKLYSIDISDIYNPGIIGEYERTIFPAEGNIEIALTQNSLFSAFYTGLLALDVSQPDSLKMQAFFKTGYIAFGLAVKDSLVFAACGYAGTWIIDISNPEKPRALKNIYTGSFPTDLVVDDSLLYILNNPLFSDTDMSRGMWIFNIADINNPVELSHYIGITNVGESNKITKSGNLVFITQHSSSAGDSTIEIIDVSDVYNPKRLGVFVSNYEPLKCTVKDSIIFLSTNGQGLKIINFTDPAHPMEVNSLFDTSYVVASEAYKNLLYVDGGYTFYALDISNPADPIILGSFDKGTPRFIENLDTSGNYVFTTEGEVFDIHNPSSPQEIGSFGFNYGYDIKTLGHLILYAGYLTDGIYILKNSLITSAEKSPGNILKTFELQQNYPNPFNPATTIEFDLPVKEKVMLEVFNLLGQRVSVLINSEMEKGKHRISFNAEGLASGIYFYRLRAGGSSITKKMVVLK